MKRVFDVLCSSVGLLVLSPPIWFFMLLIWLQDFKNPLYIAPRVGRNGRPFRMIKLRSMVANADKTGVDSTTSDDKRITWVGHIIRRYKLDEFSQLWNVLKGDMSLVGPRPNVKKGVDLYTPEERRLLNVRPGITDLSSIVFSDEGQILEGSDDPDLEYDRLIRPWKSRLGLFYVNNHKCFLDIKIIVLTVIALVSKKRALDGVQKILNSLGADSQLKRVSARHEELVPFHPPGQKPLNSAIDSR